MLVRLTRRNRAKAGWFVALLYLFCVLAPGVALALGDAAACLPAALQLAAADHVHEHGESAGHSHARDGHAADAGDARHQHPGKNAHGPCCVMLCLSGVMADLPAIATPAPPKSVSLSEKDQRLPGKAPPLLYRPPIA
jgi:hypothetical protein